MVEREISRTQTDSYSLTKSRELKQDHETKVNYLGAWLPNISGSSVK